jgi:hypothetical protein
MTTSTRNSIVYAQILVVKKYPPNGGFCIGDGIGAGVVPDDIRRLPLIGIIG